MVDLFNERTDLFRVGLEQLCHIAIIGAPHTPVDACFMCMPRV